MNFTSASFTFPAQLSPIAPLSPRLPPTPTLNPMQPGPLPPNTTFSSYLLPTNEDIERVIEEIFALSSKRWHFSTPGCIEVTRAQNVFFPRQGVFSICSNERVETSLLDFANRVSHRAEYGNEDVSTVAKNVLRGLQKLAASNTDRSSTVLVLEYELISYLGRDVHIKTENRTYVGKLVEASSWSGAGWSVLPARQYRISLSEPQELEILVDFSPLSKMPAQISLVTNGEDFEEISSQEGKLRKRNAIM